MGFNYAEFSEKINNADRARGILGRICEYASKIRADRVNIMEVCGTHTHEIFKSGIKGMLPEKIKLKSGPGCPVCVTPVKYIDAAIMLSKQKNNIIATFGDMLRVAGTGSSLEAERSIGADVRVVYSPQEAAAIAVENKAKNVIFLSVGFETTVPASAFLVKSAFEKGISNLFILEGNKTVPEALSAIVSHPGVKVDGFILPGHVSVVSGSNVFSAPLEKHMKCGVVCGFEYMDILMCVAMIIEMIVNKEFGVKNEYIRAVTPGGNAAAKKLIEEVFTPCDCEWRGLGTISGSGLKLREKYISFSAGERFAEIIGGQSSIEASKKNICRCAEVLLSLAEPPDCPSFSSACDPLNPLGPCMVSAEGSCSAYYKYGRTGDIKL